MPDRIVKPDSGNDLVLQNDDASAKIEINEAGTIVHTGTSSIDVSGGTFTTSSAQKQAIVQAGPGSGTLDVSSGTFTTSSAQKQAIVQAGPGSGTLDVSSGTFTTSTAQKQAIVDGSTIEAQDLASGSGTTLPNNVQDAITRLGTVTSGTFNSSLGTSVSFPTRSDVGFFETIGAGSPLIGASTSQDFSYTSGQEYCVLVNNNHTDGGGINPESYRINTDNTVTEVQTATGLVTPSIPSAGTLRITTGANRNVLQVLIIRMDW